LGDSNLQSKVESRLTRTGFPLEMRVAKAFRDAVEGDLDWIVLNNQSYVDSQTGAIREIDLTASAECALNTLPSSF
jgi:hypothetical protein